jgi:NAD-dependent dihydropyrimidine dehydrogenase PreA subunit
MAKRDLRDYTCEVVHEEVKVYLRHRRQRFNDQGPKTRFVQCDQDECQYVDKNELPCPLHAGMFDEVVELDEVVEGGEEPRSEDGQRLCRW